MTHPLSVRRAQVGDLEAIIELRLSLLREYADHPMYANLRPDAPDRARDLFRAQLLSPAEAIFVAEVDRQPIGILRCVDTPVSPLLFPEHYCYVSSVYVRPHDRRRGVLKALLTAAEAWCGERGIGEMRLHNTAHSDAGTVWSALGFDVVEEVRRRPLARTSVSAPVPVAEPHTLPHVTVR